MKYYIIYKITNTINGKIYIGQHTTTNINDSYMGSGLALRRAFTKYGKANFTKEILHTYDNFDDMNNMEVKLVNESFVAREDVYNITTGGHSTFHMKGYTSGKVTATNSNGDTMLLDTSDPRFTSGEYTIASKGKVSVRDVDGNTSQVGVDDPRYVSGELVHVSSGITKGRKHIHNPTTREQTMVSPEVLEEYLDNGWVLGRVLQSKLSLPTYQELELELQYSTQKELGVKYGVSPNTIAYRIHNKKNY
jgi:hypothetical protein